MGDTPQKYSLASMPRFCFEIRVGESRNGRTRNVIFTLKAAQDVASHKLRRATWRDKFEKILKQKGEKFETFYNSYQCQWDNIVNKQKIVIFGQWLSFPTPEVHGSNPVISKILFIINCIETTKIKKKRPGMAHFLKIKLWFLCLISFLMKCWT